MLPPEQRIENGYRNGGFDAVVLARVNSAWARPNAVPKMQSWTAGASVVRTLSGEFGAWPVQIKRDPGGGSCDDYTPIPKKDDLWVVYFTKGPDGVLERALSYPLEVAQQSDHKLFSK